jgi:photosynthetic reaction center cytochrome c subunit
MKLVSAFVLGALCASAQSAPAPPKLAEEAYKNIQALKGTAADELFPAMLLMTASLGVNCEFCHVKDKFDVDEKKPKDVARKMITMTIAINKDNFKGNTNVTCNTCHNGHAHPVGIPPIPDEDPKPQPEAAPPAPVSLPTTDQILEKYVSALGGADAIHKISSRVAKGTMTVRGHEMPIEIFMKAPDKRISITHAPNGDNIMAFDGKAGWLGDSAHPPRDMGRPDTAEARLDADLYFATHVKESFSQFRVARPEKIGDQETQVLFGTREGEPPLKMYFSSDTGLLVREVRYTQTPVGRNQTQVDFADYRDANGVKVPYRWTIAKPIGRLTIQVKELQQNVPIDDAKFAKP